MAEDEGGRRSETMRCSICQFDNPPEAAFCSSCGGSLQVPPATLADKPRKRRGLLFYLGIGIACCVLGLLVFAVVAIVRGEAEDRRKEAAYAAQRQKQMEAQRAFDATPAGKKAQAAQDKELRQREAEKTGRVIFAMDLEKTMLDRGLDVNCAVSEDKRTLYVTGPAVNRVFAHQFMAAPGVAKNLRAVGFAGVTFWNGNHFSEIFTQEYDLTR